jgi:hypothetical protein
MSENQQMQNKSTNQQMQKMSAKYWAKDAKRKKEETDAWSISAHLLVKHRRTEGFGAKGLFEHKPRPMMKAVLSILNENIRQNRVEINRPELFSSKDASKPISKMTNNQLGFACEAKLQELVQMDRMMMIERRIMIERQRAHARAESAKTCPICIEPIGQNGQNGQKTESCTTVCGHTFCTPCFLRLLNSGYAQVKCPCCRLVIQESRSHPNHW